MFDVAPTVLDALAFPDEVAAGLAQWAPQALLVDVLAELAPAALSVDGQIDALVAMQRHMGLLQAQEVELLAALDASDRSRDGFTRDAVAAALRVPPASMRTRMTLARDLAERLPDTLALLRAGEITQRHALDLADAVGPLTPESAAAVEAQVLPRAPELTQAQFRAAVRREVLKVTSPAEEEAAHQDAVGERRVVLIPGCRRKAQYDDLDHVEAWREGDQTTVENLLSLCRRHHRLKHSGRWRIDRDDATGVTVWTDRRGRTYRTRAPHRPTTTTTAADPTNPTATPLTVTTANTVEFKLPPTGPPSTARPGTLCAAVEAARIRARSPMPSNPSPDDPPPF